MIKEYEDIKLFIDEYFRNELFKNTFKEIFTNEYNALEIILIDVLITDKIYNKFKSDINKHYNNIVTSYELLIHQGTLMNSTIILYLKKPQEIRSEKIYKIRKLCFRV